MLGLLSYIRLNVNCSSFITFLQFFLTVLFCNSNYNITPIINIFKSTYFLSLLSIYFVTRHSQYLAHATGFHLLGGGAVKGSASDEFMEVWNRGEQKMAERRRKAKAMKRRKANMQKLMNGQQTTSSTARRKKKTNPVVLPYRRVFSLVCPFLF